MITIIGTFTIVEGKEADILKGVEELVAGVEKEEGTLVYLVNTTDVADAKPPFKLVFYESYGNEEALNIHLQHPASPCLHQALPRSLERLVCRPLWAEAIRAVQKVLLVDCLQQHRDCTLQDLVLKGRNPYGSRLATVPLRDVHPTHGRRLIASGLEAFE